MYYIGIDLGTSAVKLLPVSYTHLDVYKRQGLYVGAGTDFRQGRIFQRSIQHPARP